MYFSHKSKQQPQWRCCEERELHPHWNWDTHSDKTGLIMDPLVTLNHNHFFLAGTKSMISHC